MVAALQVRTSVCQVCAKPPGRWPSMETLCFGAQWGTLPQNLLASDVFVCNLVVAARVPPTTKGPAMATTTKRNTTTTTKASKASVAQAATQVAQAAQATVQATAQATHAQAQYLVPTAAQWQAANSSSAQGQLCHACMGNTMPPAYVRVGVGSGSPKGHQGGTRQAHQQAMLAALGAGANTVGAVVAHACKAGTKLGPGDVRCALQQGVLVVLPPQ